jgi:hypothetical protein
MTIWWFYSTVVPSEVTVPVLVNLNFVRKFGILIVLFFSFTNADDFCPDQTFQGVRSQILINISFLLTFYKNKSIHLSYKTFMNKEITYGNGTCIAVYTSTIILYTGTDANKDSKMSK